MFAATVHNGIFPIRCLSTNVHLHAIIIICDVRSQAITKNTKKLTAKRLSAIYHFVSIIIPAKDTNMMPQRLQNCFCFMNRHFTTIIVGLQKKSVAP